MSCLNSVFCNGRPGCGAQRCWNSVGIHAATALPFIPLTCRGSLKYRAARACRWRSSSCTPAFQAAFRREDRITLTTPHWMRSPPPSLAQAHYTLTPFNPRSAHGIYTCYSCWFLSTCHRLGILFKPLNTFHARCILMGTVPSTSTFVEASLRQAQRTFHLGAAVLSVSRRTYLATVPFRAVDADSFLQQRSPLLNAGLAGSVTSFRYARC